MQKSSSNPSFESPSSKIVANKTDGSNYGRWKRQEQILFESLFELYGKNWKKIYHHLNGRRTLAQIRSHAQKYFTKIGRTKLQEIQRRTKILQAIETLRNEKIQDQEKELKNIFSESQISEKVKKEEQSQNYIQFLPIKIK